MSMIKTPLPPDYRIGNAELEIKASEKNGYVTTDYISTLSQLLEHFEYDGANDKHLKVILDWAIQIEFLEKMNSSDALHAAITFYLG